ncbi:MAG: response regulator [Candidatus Omnitrophota bacterium]|nr:response regulator [Candidatus Omnitrophota bacterium]
MTKTTVLIVDDELDFLDLMRTRIESWGYGLATATNGKEAIEAVRKIKPDILILDYMLPDTDGIATLKEIRKTDDKLPVIMFTAYPDAKAMKGSEELKVSAFIPKLSVYADVEASLKAALAMATKKISTKER